MPLENAVYRVPSTRNQHDVSWRGFHSPIWMLTLMRMEPPAGPTEKKGAREILAPLTARRRSS